MTRALIKVGLLLSILATNLLAASTFAQGADEVCGATFFHSLPQLVLRHKKATREAMQERIVRFDAHRFPLFFDDVDDRSLNDYIDNYIKAVPNSAVMIFAAEDKHICMGLWARDVFLRNSKYILYARIPDGAQLLGRYSRELALALDVESTWQLRSKGKGGELPASAKTRQLEAIVKDVSRLFFPPSARLANGHANGIFLELLRSVKHLTIVPVRGMSAVPVAMLEPFADGKPVIDYFSVNFLTSLSDIKRGAEQWSRKLSSSLIIGNPRPSYDKEFTWAICPALKVRRRQHTLFLGERC